jgi:DnaJ-class molecular chaperone
VLSDTESRTRYDRLGAAWRTADSPFQTRTRTYGAVPDLEDIFGGPGADLGGIFSNLFRRGATATAERAPLEQPVTVSLEEAYAGTSRLLTLASADGSARRLEVRIPPGVREGSRVHVAPDSATNGSEDIYLVVSVQPHTAFQRDGDDVTVKVPVPLTTAVLGGEVQVPTLKGSRLALRIPEETQNGRKLRLRGQGMPKLGGDSHGDLFAEVSVVIPTHLSEEERKLFERLHELRTPK